LARCHITVDRTTWRTLEEDDTATKEVREAVEIKMKLANFDDTPQAFTIVAFSLLILIRKNVTENNRDGWFENRWRALAHIASVLIDADRIEPHNNTRIPPPPGRTLQNSNRVSQVICKYCKKTGHIIEDCCKRMYNNQSRNNQSYNGQRQGNGRTPVNTGAAPGPG
jgi:hypothetical protein